jgi:hypothetical protein
MFGSAPLPKRKLIQAYRAAVTMCSAVSPVVTSRVLMIVVPGSARASLTSSPFLFLHAFEELIAFRKLGLRRARHGHAKASAAINATRSPRRFVPEITLLPPLPSAPPQTLMGASSHLAQGALAEHEPPTP